MKKDRLNIGKLKILGYEFLSGKECLQSIKQNKRRRYTMDKAVDVIIFTNAGILHVITEEGFEFDGRSGPKIVDWYAPNLGTLGERLCWLAHDCNGYGQDLSFKDTNTLLFAMLRDICGYRKTKAALIRYAVSLSDAWYGEPKPTEWCYKNKGKVRTIWTGK